QSPPSARRCQTGGGGEVSEGDDLGEEVAVLVHVLLALDSAGLLNVGDNLPGVVGEEGDEVVAVDVPVELETVEVVGVDPVGFGDRDVHFDSLGCCSLADKTNIPPAVLGVNTSGGDVLLYRSCG